MAQPTIEGLTLNVGSGGGSLAYDTVSGKIWQAILVGYSTGDGTASVVMADTGLPVVSQSGATWACTQSGTWNITNISGTVSLPTGASTAANQTAANALLTTIDADTSTLAAVDYATSAKQPALGTAGTASADVLTVQGIASMTPLIVDLGANNDVTVTGTVTANAGTGTFAVSAASLPLPSGAATESTLSTLSGKVTACNTGAIVMSSGVLTSITNPVAVTGTFWQTTQPISAASLPLPSGAATESTLSTLSGKVTACNTGAVVVASGSITADCNGSDVTVDNTASNPAYVNIGSGGNGMTVLTAHADAVSNTANHLKFGSMAYVFNGTTWDRLRGDTTNGAYVNVTALPAGNLGQKTSAASLSITPATDIADATYLGDIKFGESLPAGTNAIGKLAANSGVDIGDVDVTSIAAGTNTIGGTISQPSSSVLYDGTTACTIKRKSGVAVGGAPGTDALIGAVVGKKFRIHALLLKATSATVNNVYLATTTDTDVFGNSGNPIPLAVDADGDNDSGLVLPWNLGGWTETSTANEALNLHTSAAQDIIYAITYTEVA